MLTLSGMKILLVEDDCSAVAVLSDILTAQYYAIDVASDGQAGLELAMFCKYDLVLLDLLVPKLDGISLCRELRSQGVETPILLLTAKDSRADVVRGLDAGADDYMTKPYDSDELLARIRSLLRRGETKLAPTVLTWGKLSVNLAAAEVMYAKQLVSLSPKEYSLLGLFLRNPGRIFSRSDIIDRLWSLDASPSEGTVTNLIKDLRQKLKVAGMTADLLETVYGLGYRLRASPEVDEEGGGDGEGRVSCQAPSCQTKLASVNKVLERYQGTFAARVDELEQVAVALRVGKLSQALCESAAQEAHKLTGALGSFGYENGSRLARSLEQLLVSDRIFEQESLAQFAKLIADLKQELREPPVPLTIQKPESSPLPLVLVVAEAGTLTRSLQTDAFACGFRVKVATHLTSVQHTIAQHSPDLILFKLDTEEGGKTELALLETLKVELPGVPVVVIAERDSLSDRVAVSRLGVRRFLHQPIASADVFKVINQVLSEAQAAEASVMILDDDPIMLEALGNMLQPWGLRVITLHNPLRFWDVLTATQPDLLILDLEMPEFSGIDLCRVVRQDPQWGNLPILVVTAYADIQSIQQVFAAGADDFIAKPVVGPELITRVISRIDRVDSAKIVPSSYLSY